MIPVYVETEPLPPSPEPEPSGPGFVLPSLQVPSAGPSPVELTGAGAKLNAFTVEGPSKEVIFGTYDRYGDYWWWTDVAGWFTSTPFQSSVESVGSSDTGTWPERFQRTPREYTITGICFAGDVARALAARDRLLRDWGDPDTVFSLVVNEPAEPKWASVRLAGQISAPWKDSIGAGKGFTFEIPLIAKDALRYGRTEITATTAPASGPAERTLTMPLFMPVIFTVGAGEAGGTAVLHNPGNENTPPTTTIRGGALPRGWRISNDGDSGRRLWVDVALRATDVLVIDHRTGDVTLNGYGIGVPVYGQWWTLRPGDNRIRLTSPKASSATATVSAYPAYR